MVQLGSFLGVMPVRRGSLIISLLSIVLYIALFIVYIVIYNKKEIDADKYTAFDVWMILAMITHVIKVLMGGLLFFAVQQEIPGLLMLWSFGFFGTSVIGVVFDIALIILWSWWMIVPIIIAVVYLYFEIVTFSYYKELSGTSFNT
ncbi:uncharacterized protein LOC128987139 [Macrosteles quadrilineatus]|uniref:uncharacterized protein LOC128987139 n=1 Tax=Macrosteles quadrilineatus TaxID=74068 RepID=UPI0023E126EF|nr:uncharacterized protein LOC128987139 [Macrosteles quadrilineatus]XP_054263838.1 uncharacterized protein LOC128987139 [Macrosteles quadrilineatus]XP_054263840.1 uncharacterized protein LOC128987139 [Macrosteles quadrilineatus]